MTPKFEVGDFVEVHDFRFPNGTCGTIVRTDLFGGVVVGTSKGKIITLPKNLKFVRRRGNLRDIKLTFRMPSKQSLIGAERRYLRMSIPRKQIQIKPNRQSLRDSLYLSMILRYGFGVYCNCCKKIRAVF